jgi:hypothetical protein
METHLGFTHRLLWKDFGSAMLQGKVEYGGMVW